MNKKNLVLFCLLGCFQAVFAQTVNPNSTISVLNSLLETEQVKDIRQVFNYKYFLVTTSDYRDGVLGMDGKWLIELGEQKIDALYNIVWCVKEVGNNEYVAKIYDMQDGKELHSIRAFDESDFRERAELEMLEFITSTMCGTKKHNIKSGYYVDFKSMYVDIDLMNNASWDKAYRDGYIKLTGEGGYDAIFKDGKVFYNTSNRHIEYLGNELFIENKSRNKSMKILTFDDLLSN